MRLPKLSSQRVQQSQTYILNSKAEKELAITAGGSCIGASNHQSRAN
jgi:hypothetical protein